MPGSSHLGCSGTLCPTRWNFPTHMWTVWAADMLHTLFSSRGPALERALHSRISPCTCPSPSARKHTDWCFQQLCFTAPSQKAGCTSSPKQVQLHSMSTLNGGVESLHGNPLTTKSSTFFLFLPLGVSSLVFPPRRQCVRAPLAGLASALSSQSSSHHLFSYVA